MRPLARLSGLSLLAAFLLSPLAQADLISLATDRETSLSSTGYSNSQFAYTKLSINIQPFTDARLASTSLASGATELGFTAIDAFNFTTPKAAAVSTPEPGTFVLLGIGGALLLVLRRQIH